jgi:hypothetical protein
MAEEILAVGGPLNGCRYNSPTGGTALLMHLEPTTGEAVYRYHSFVHEEHAFDEEAAWICESLPIGVAIEYLEKRHRELKPPSRRPQVDKVSPFAPSFRLRKFIGFCFSAFVILAIMAAPLVPAYMMYVHSVADQNLFAALVERVSLNQ